MFVCQHHYVSYSNFVVNFKVRKHGACLWSLLEISLDLQDPLYGCTHFSTCFFFLFAFVKNVVGILTRISESRDHFG